MTVEQAEEIIRLLIELQDTGTVIIGCIAVQTGLHLAAEIGRRFFEWIR